MNEKPCLGWEATWSDTFMCKPTWIVALSFSHGPFLPKLLGLPLASKARCKSLGHNKSCMKHSCHLIERLKRKSWAAPPSRGSKHGLLYSLTSVSKGASGSNAKRCVLLWRNTLLYFYSRKTPASSSSTESNISWQGKTFQVMDKCQCGKVRRLSLQPIHLKCHAWNLSWCVIAALHPGHANAKQVEHSGTVTLRRLSIDIWFVIIVGQNILPWMLTTFKHVNPSGCNSVNAAGR